MSRIIRYIDAREQLTHPEPGQPMQDEQAWRLEVLVYVVILGLMLTGVLLACAYR